MGTWENMRNMGNMKKAKETNEKSNIAPLKHKISLKNNPPFFAIQNQLNVFNN